MPNFHVGFQVYVAVHSWQKLFSPIAAVNQEFILSQDQLVVYRHLSTDVAVYENDPAVENVPNVSQGQIKKQIITTGWNVASYRECKCEGWQGGTLHIMKLSKLCTEIQASRFDSNNDPGFGEDQNECDIDFIIISKRFPVHVNTRR